MLTFCLLWIQCYHLFLICSKVKQSKRSLIWISFLYQYRNGVCEWRSRTRVSDSHSDPTGALCFLFFLFLFIRFPCYSSPNLNWQSLLFIQSDTHLHSLISIPSNEISIFAFKFPNGVGEGQKSRIIIFIWQTWCKHVIISFQPLDDHKWHWSPSTW